MKTLIIIQARIGSTRFPGKIAAQLGPCSVLEHVVRRARHRGYTVCLAIPTVDAASLTWAQDFRRAVPDRKGDAKFVPIYFAATEEEDVLGRFCQTARWAHDMDRFTNGGEGYGCIVRLTADCPLIPVAAIDAVAEAITEGLYDYCETRSDPSSRPNGIDAQAFTMERLQQATQAVDQFEDSRSAREHMTPILQRVALRPGRIKTVEGLDLDEIPGFRMTVDTPDDLERMNRWAEHVPMDPTAGRPTLVELKHLHRTQPELFAMVKDGK